MIPSDVITDHSSASFSYILRNTGPKAENILKARYVFSLLFKRCGSDLSPLPSGVLGFLEMQGYEKRDKTKPKEFKSAELLC